MTGPLPDEVFVSNNETLPRSLVSSMGRSGCRRCGSAGWFKFAGSSRLMLCPCAQAAVAKKVAEARSAAEALRKRPILELMAEVCDGMAARGAEPAAMICHRAIAARVRESATDVVEEGAGFTVSVGARRIRVMPDNNAPPEYARFFSAEDFERWEQGMRAQASEKVDDAAREAAAADELAAIRTQLVKPL